jgi:hypothetical protein
MAEVANGGHVTVRIAVGVGQCYGRTKTLFFIGRSGGRMIEDRVKYLKPEV